MQPVADKRWVTFMLSFSNYLPLPAAEVSRIGRTVTAWPFDFDRIYGGWWGQVCRLLFLPHTSAVCLCFQIRLSFQTSLSFQAILLDVMGLQPCQKAAGIKAKL